MSSMSPRAQPPYGVSSASSERSSGWMPTQKSSEEGPQALLRALRRIATLLLGEEPLPHRAQQQVRRSRRR